MPGSFFAFHWDFSVMASKSSLVSIRTVASSSAERPSTMAWWVLVRSAQRPPARPSR